MPSAEDHFLEPDFWPGMTSGLPVTREQRGDTPDLISSVT
jgi:hypothetical protein